MAYSELIKNYGRIRDYLRQFYVFGFKSRNGYTSQSTRSYDNERRRLESWLGEYMCFRRNAGGKKVFLSVDSRAISSNPLYTAFKAKSFTAHDIMLHFYILDLLAEGKRLTAPEILAGISGNYLTHFEAAAEPDLSTVRKKLKEYAELGLLRAEKQGNKLYYARQEDCIALEQWREALAFFAEALPLGVIGATLQDKLEQQETHFRFKHHYILHALDSEILYKLLLALGEQRCVCLTHQSGRAPAAKQFRVLPLQIYCSTQTGREYLLCWHYALQRFAFFRLDNIRTVTALDIEKQYGDYQERLTAVKAKLWGVSLKQQRETEHIEMTVCIDAQEQYIVQRLQRERRCGSVEQLDAQHYRYSADVYDAKELLPWLRTFIGRITELKCTNAKVTQTFYADLQAMMELYGGSKHAVQ